MVYVTKSRVRTMKMLGFILVKEVTAALHKRRGHFGSLVPICIKEMKEISEKEMRVETKVCIFFLLLYTCMLLDY